MNLAISLTCLIVLALNLALTMHMAGHQAWMRSVLVPWMNSISQAVNPQKK